MKDTSRLGKLFRREPKMDTSLALDAVTYAIMDECHCTTSPRLNVLIGAFIQLNEIFIENGQSLTDDDSEDESSDDLKDEYTSDGSHFEEKVDEQTGDRLRFGLFSSYSAEFLAFVNKNLSNNFADLEDNKQVIETIQFGLESGFPPVMEALCQFIMLERGLNVDAPSVPFGYLQIEKSQYGPFKECFQYGTLLFKVGINPSLIKLSRQEAQLESILKCIPTSDQLCMFHLGKTI
jgi:hypothetical protein